MRKKVLFLILFFGVGIFLTLFLILETTKASISTTTVSIVVSVCGNGIIESGEECDGSNLGGQTCESLGYYSGTLSCNPDCTFDTSNCQTAPPSGGGGGGYVPPSTETKVVLQGKAYPSAKITILKDGEVGEIITADSNANFKTEIKEISPGIWNFSLWAEDKEGRRSITISFSVTILEGKITTISNIFIPPTIELDKTKVAKGEDLKIFGQTAPESQISIHIESPQEIIRQTKAKESGDWEDIFNTSPLDEGMHVTRAKAKSPEGLESSFSSVLAFYIGEYKPGEICPRADFNKDGRTNLIDFSILLYWWGKYNPCVDVNGDGKVNLPDFSILMYWWTG
jgi:hypothetical protein